MNKEEPITSVRVYDTINLLRDNDNSEITLHLHKHEAKGSTMPNETRLTFDKFEKPRSQSITAVL